jgi:hypothetical protein
MFSNFIEVSSPAGGPSPTGSERKQQFQQQAQYDEWFTRTNGDQTLAGDRPSEQINYTNKKQLDTVWAPKGDVKLQPKDAYEQ